MAHTMVKGLVEPPKGLIVRKLQPGITIELWEPTYKGVKTLEVLCPEGPGTLVFIPDNEEVAK